MASSVLYAEGPTPTPAPKAHLSPYPKVHATAQTETVFGTIIGRYVEETRTTNEPQCARARRSTTPTSESDAQNSSGSDAGNTSRDQHGDSRADSNSLSTPEEHEPTRQGDRSTSATDHAEAAYGRSLVATDHDSAVDDRSFVTTDHRGAIYDRSLVVTDHEGDGYTKPRNRVTREPDQERSPQPRRLVGRPRRLARSWSGRRG